MFKLSSATHDPVSHNIRRDIMNRYQKIMHHFPLRTLSRRSMPKGWTLSGCGYNVTTRMLSSNGVYYETVGFLIVSLDRPPTTTLHQEWRQFEQRSQHPNVLLRNCVSSAALWRPATFSSTPTHVPLCSSPHSTMKQVQKPAHVRMSGGRAWDDVAAPRLAVRRSRGSNYRLR